MSCRIKIESYKIKYVDCKNKDGKVLTTQDCQLEEDQNLRKELYLLLKLKFLTIREKQIECNWINRSIIQLKEPLFLTKSCNIKDNSRNASFR